MNEGHYVFGTIYQRNTYKVYCIKKFIFPDTELTFDRWRMFVNAMEIHKHELMESMPWIDDMVHFNRVFKVVMIDENGARDNYVHTYEKIDHGFLWLDVKYYDEVM